jgi:hypothetical protein
MAAFKAGRLTISKSNRPAVKTWRQNVGIAESLDLSVNHKLAYPVFDKIGPRLLDGTFKTLGNPLLPHLVGVLWSDGLVGEIAQLGISKVPGYSQGLSHHMIAGPSRVFAFPRTFFNRPLHQTFGW